MEMAGKGTSMKVVVHIGMHKAASTSIGIFTASNKKILEKHGVIAPQYGRHNLGHRKVVYDVFDFAGYSPIQDYQEYRHEKRWMKHYQETYVEKCRAANSRLMFLSSETIEDYTHNTKKFSMLLDWLGGFASDIEFVVVIRDQASFINSVYCQGAKTLKRVQDFEQALPQILEMNILNYKKRFSALFETGQKLTVIPFPQLVGEGIDRLLIGKVFGIEDRDIYDQIVTPLKRNANPGIKAVAAGLEIRKNIDAKLIGRSFPEEVRHAMRIKFVKMTRELGWTSTSYSGLDNKLAHRIMERFAERNDAFARLVWGADWTDVYELPKFYVRKLDPGSLGREEQEEFQDVVRYMDEMFDQLMTKYVECAQ